MTNFEAIVRLIWWKYVISAKTYKINVGRMSYFVIVTVNKPFYIFILFNLFFRWSHTSKHLCIKVRASARDAMYLSQPVTLPFQRNTCVSHYRKNNLRLVKRPTSRIFFFRFVIFVETSKAFRLKYVHGILCLALLELYVTVTI